MKIRLFLTVSIILILFLFGCATEQPYKPTTLPRTSESQPQVAEEPLSAAEKLPKVEALPSLAFSREVPEKPLPPREPFDTKRISLTEGPVLINVEKMPLSDFIIYALGETLKVAFVMDEQIMANKTPITMSMPGPMPADKALEIIVGLFERYGLYLEEKAGALYVLNKSPEPKQPFDVRVGREGAESSADILQVVPLRHLRVYEIEPLIREMFKTGIQIKPYIKENVLILYGKAFQIKQVIEFINIFDLPSLGGNKLFLLRLTYWQANDFIKQISAILEGLGFVIAKTSKDPGIMLIPIKQLNSILVISPDDTTAKYVLDWKDRLDTAEASGTEEKSYVYVPKYSRASDLAESINKLYGGVSSTAAATTTAQKTTATLGSASLSTTSSSTAPSTTTRPAGGASIQTLTQIDFRLSADDSKNLILTICTPAIYKNLLNLLIGLDTPPKQVLIEATIVELTLSGDLKYGMEWYLKSKHSGGGSTLQTMDQLGLSSFGGLSYQFIANTENIKATIHAFAQDDRAKILSTPRLMVLDNKEASIQVGQDIPVATQDLSSSTGSTSSSVTRTYQYRSTGIILRVKPTINTEGLLTLEISQEVSSAGSGDTPILSMRRISTSVAVAHAQTIALGGLMKEESAHTIEKVPLLGDIPLLGHLFKTTSQSSSKTELLILVTPTIITNTDEAGKITEELRNQLKWFK